MAKKAIQLRSPEDQVRIAKDPTSVYQYDQCAVQWKAHLSQHSHYRIDKEMESRIKDDLCKGMITYSFTHFLASKTFSYDF